MRPTSLLTVLLAAVLSLAAGAAQAADAMQLAEHSGFLLGNAHRCGVSGDRVVRMGQRIVVVILAMADDASEANEATKRFAQVFLANGGSDQQGLIASCRAVSAEFIRLERHRATVSAARGLPLMRVDPD